MVKQLQANLDLAIRLPILPSPNIKAKKKEKKNFNKPSLNYTKLHCRQQMIHTSHHVIISKSIYRWHQLFLQCVQLHVITIMMINEM